jgi:hypothetical protein
MEHKERLILGSQEGNWKTSSFRYKNVPVHLWCCMLIATASSKDTADVIENASAPLIREYIKSVSQSLAEDIFDTD